MKIAKQLFTVTTIITSTNYIRSTSGFSNFASFVSLAHYVDKSQIYQYSNSRKKMTNNDNEVQRLLDKAAKIRQELALLEGKTIEQVEQEAKDQKERVSTPIVSNNNTQDNIRTQSSSSSSQRQQQLLYLPTTIDEQIQQATYAIERAYQDGISRQTVRLALEKRDNKYLSIEEEEWPGGAKQIHREAGRPMTEALLTQIRAFAPSSSTIDTKLNDDESSSSMNIEEINSIKRQNNMESFQKMQPPTIKFQDIYDFDGSALLTAESSLGAIGDVQALLFPNTDTKYLNDIKSIHDQFGLQRLFILVNPFWKNVNSWSFNILAPNGKKKAQEIVFDCEGGGFQETYVLTRFSVRGENCAALKAYPYDWQIFAFLEEKNGYGNQGGVNAIRLGSSKEEPTSAIITDLLNGKDEFKVPKTMRQMRGL